MNEFVVIERGGNVFHVIVGLVAQFLGSFAKSFGHIGIEGIADVNDDLRGQAFEETALLESRAHGDNRGIQLGGIGETVFHEGPNTGAIRPDVGFGENHDHPVMLVMFFDGVNEFCGLVRSIGNRQTAHHHNEPTQTPNGGGGLVGDDISPPREIEPDRGQETIGFEGVVAIKEIPFQVGFAELFLSHDFERESDFRVNPKNGNRHDIIKKVGNESVNPTAVIPLEFLRKGLDLDPVAGKVVVQGVFIVINASVFH